MNLKILTFDENPGNKDIYKNAENPEFELFYINIEEVETFRFTEGSKTYTMK